mmetsp:Transcript_7586/g.20564  ORF Transcript_7586/g.20564 Transcript_7586/m.20564 type:complete len:281 (+) Transcript_7586:565-1407(+)
MQADPDNDHRIFHPSQGVFHRRVRLCHCHVCRARPLRRRGLADDAELPSHRVGLCDVERICRCNSAERAGTAVQAGIIASGGDLLHEHLHVARHGGIDVAVGRFHGIAAVSADQQRPGLLHVRVHIHRVRCDIHTYDGGEEVRWCGGRARRDGTEGDDADPFLPVLSQAILLVLCAGSVSCSGRSAIFQLAQNLLQKADGAIQREGSWHDSTDALADGWHIYTDQRHRLQQIVMIVGSGWRCSTIRNNPHDSLTHVLLCGCKILYNIIEEKEREEGSRCD